MASQSDWKKPDGRFGWPSIDEDAGGGADAGGLPSPLPPASAERNGACAWPPAKVGSARGVATAPW
jgi:hypothetical protein